MSHTLVLQSHRSPLPHAWIGRCLASVRAWSEMNGHDYRFVDDALFDLLPAGLMETLQGRRVMASDLARLKLMQAGLAEGYATVIWLDADFLIHDPQRFIPPDADHAVGREVWIQHGEDGRLKAYKKVHNAFLMFRRGNAFLAFYLESAQRLLAQCRGGVPPQFIGPKLLTALHNVVQLPVMERAAMFSPPLIEAIARGEGAALELFEAKSEQAPAGANLCISSVERGELDNATIERAIDRLLDGARLSAKQGQ